MMPVSLRALLCASVLLLAFAAPAAAQSAPGWMRVDHDAKTVHLAVVAGKTTANNSWNFNGYARGEATVVVPLGYTVELTFSNQDKAMAHSLAVLPAAEAYPAVFTDPALAFSGAATSHPTDMMKATQPGGKETIRFVADAAGDYAMLCLVPGHATVGMWIGLRVADGAAPTVLTPGR